MLEFVIAFNEQHGRFPALRDLRVGLGYETNQNVRYHLILLRDTGLVSFKGGVITGARRIA